jgi:hypothetical protein
MNIAPYIRQLTDEYKHFIFLLLAVLAGSLNGEPPKQTNYTRINHLQHQYYTHNQFILTFKFLILTTKFKRIETSLKFTPASRSADSGGLGVRSRAAALGAVVAGQRQSSGGGRAVALGWPGDVGRATAARRRWLSGAREAALRWSGNGGGRATAADRWWLGYDGRVAVAGHRVRWLAKEEVMAERVVRRRRRCGQAARRRRRWCVRQGGGGRERKWTW